MDKLWVFDKSSERLRAVLVSGKQSRGACRFFNAIHTESINEFDRLEFYVVADHEDAKHVVERNLVAFRDIDLNWRLFIIREVTDTHDHIKTKRVLCESAATELRGEPIDDISLRPGTAGEALERLLAGTRWRVGNVGITGSRNVRFHRGNVLIGINTILDAWDGELRFRATISGKSITGRYVDLVQRLGRRTKKRFEFGKDVQGIEKVADSSTIVTAVRGYGKSEHAEDGTEIPLTFADVEWSAADGDPVDKPKGQDWVGDPEARDTWGYPNPDGSKRHIFGEYNDDDQEDPEILLRMSWLYLHRVNAPKVEYTASVVDLERAFGEEYRHENVRLGDDIFVIDREFVPELRAEARVLEIARHLDQPEQTVVRLGNFLETFTDGNSRLRDVENRIGEKISAGEPIQTSWLRGLIDAVNNEIRAGAGTIRVTDEGMLILDKPEDQNPTKAILLNNGIVAVSNKKVNNEWYFEHAMTGDGIIADRIFSGTLDASRVTIRTDSEDADGERDVIIHDGYVTTHFDGRISTMTGKYGISFYPWNMARPYFSGRIYATSTTGVEDDGLIVSGKDFVVVGKYEFPSVMPNIRADFSANRLFLGSGKVRLGFISDLSVWSGPFVDPTNEIIRVSEDFIWLKLQGASEPSIYIGEKAFIMPNLGGYIYWAFSDTNYIRQKGSDGSIEFVMGNTIRHQFNADGSKSGGTIDIDGKTWGMSPIDSPQVLIEDIIFDHPVDENGVPVELEDRFSKSITKYAVFPSRGDVVVTEKTPTGFKVTGGSAGTVDLRVIGVRVGKEDVYFEEMIDPQGNAQMSAMSVSMPKRPRDISPPKIKEIPTPPDTAEKEAPK